MGSAPKTTKRNILTTRNYRLFKISEENRVLDLSKHKKLKNSMQIHGYIRSFPIICVRGKNGSLIVKDGQHRLALAEELKLPVSYVEETVDFDIALINSTPKVWSLIDYAMKYSSNGIHEYQEGLEFSARHGISPGASFAILAGTISFSNIAEDFYAGKFKIKERRYAELVAFVYSAIINKAKHLRGARFLEACMVVCRVDGFKPSRLVHGMSKCMDKLISYSTREAYIDMIEEIYNYHRKQLVSLKVPALQIMRDRQRGKGV